MELLELKRDPKSKDIAARLKKQQVRQRERRAAAAKERQANLRAAKERRQKILDAAKTAKAAREKPAGLSQVPAQIAHCMMAVHVKGKKSKAAAWNICRWAMTKYGYLKGPYRVNTKMPKAVIQTGKGTRRSFQHGTEKKPLNGGLPGNGTSKFRKFVRLFKSLEPKLLPKGT